MMPYTQMFLIFFQISHTLLSLINPDTGKPFPGTQKRLSIFSKMIQSGVSQSFHGIGGVQPSLSENDAMGKHTRDPSGIACSLSLDENQSCSFFSMILYGTQRKEMLLRLSALSCEHKSFPKACVM